MRTSQTEIHFRVVREEDVAACNIWEDQGDNGGFVIWTIIVALPIIAGPVLTGTLEFFACLGKKCSRSPSPPTPSLAKYWVMLAVLSLIIPATLAAHLWLVETVLQPRFKLDYFTCLGLKYFLGNSDVFLVPSLILIMDGTLRRGLGSVCRMRKDTQPENV